MLSITQIAKIVNPINHRLEQPNATITHLLTDSRLLETSQNCLFFAISGRLNGHQFVNELAQKGVTNFIVSEPLETFKTIKGNFIQVKQVKTALQQIAQAHRKQFNCPVIGVTGSNGKTIVKEWLGQLLQQQFNVVKNAKSYNSQIGVPLSVWHMQNQHDLAIFEAGISQPNEMQKLQQIIQPSIGIFTNIGSAHSENFTSLQQKITEKAKLFAQCNVLVYCQDQPETNQHFAKNKPAKMQLLSWSFANPNAPFYFQKTGNKQLQLSAKNKLFTFNLPFGEPTAIENVCHCIVTALYLGLNAQQIQTGINQLSALAMRLELKPAVNNCLVINDSYNSDLESLKVALEFMQSQKKLKQTLVLSDIQQTGIPKEKLYKQVAQLLKKYKLNKLFTVGENSLELSKYKPAKNYQHHYNTSSLLQNLNHWQFVNEAILLKGARHFELENVVNVFQEKQHETVFEINLDAIYHNLQFFASHLKPATNIMVMVKALAYGTGKTEVVKMLEYLKVNYLGVAFADEGVALRKAGITLPIMVLNTNRNGFYAMYKYNLEPEIYSFNILKQWLQFLKDNAITQPLNVHIKIDTGMHRLGFEPNEVNALIEVINNNPQLKIQSVLSHLTSSDNPEHDAFTQQQISTFTQVVNEIKQATGRSFLTHIVNSSGIVRFKNAHFNMVRLGIGLYGINQFYQDKLQFVGSLKTRISQIKQIQKGQTIGYNRMGIAQQNMRIATLPIGYADGLNRGLSNGIGSVYLHNKRAKIIGNVCMDMVMVDITNIPQAREGDTVEIFGPNIPVWELADKLNTIPYEILTSISPRVKRVFLKQ